MRMRRSVPCAAGLAFILALAACSGQGPTTAPPPPIDGAGKDAHDEPTLVGDFLVTYAGRTYDGQTTTFRWNVSGAEQEPGLAWFLVELPACAPEPVAWEPVEPASFHTVPEHEVYGIKWLLGADPQDGVGRPFILTFPGEVAAGRVRTVVRSVDGTTLGEIPGPCAGPQVPLFAVAGTVFTDADFDGLQGSEEGGIADVDLEIIGTAGAVATVRTDAEGRWSANLAAGDYTVAVGAGADGGFNPSLAELFSPTTPLEVAVTLGPDTTGIDFGFTPDAERIIADLEEGVLLADGENVDWWRRQVYAGLRISGGVDGKPHSQLEGYYTPERLLEFIAAIEAFYLPDPYAFTPGSELQDAYDKLRAYPMNPAEKLYRELLVSEFNHVSGRGLAGVAPALQEVLIAWGETLLVQAAADKADVDLLGAARIFRGINTGGGGSIDE